MGLHWFQAVLVSINMGLTVLVDVDDTTVALKPKWVRDINRKFGTRLEPKDITNWNIHEFVERAAGKTIDPNDVYGLVTADLYLEVEPIEGALYGINLLRQRGHEVLFATSVLRGCEGAKLDLLKRHGFIDKGGVYGDGRIHSDYFEAYDKSKIRADILIDDRDQNVIDFPGTAILYDQFHNRHLDWKYRAKSWIDVVEMVDSIEAEINHRASADSQVARMISGVGKDAPMAVNAAGGKQSHLPYAFHLVDPVTMFVLARILAEGSAKYGEWNWRRISVNDNLNHALSHIFAYLSGDVQDDHLGHAFCRLMFALSKEYNSDPKGLMEPK